MCESRGDPLEVLAGELARRGLGATMCGGALVLSRGERVIACDGWRFRWGGERGHVLGEVGAEAVAAERVVRVLRQVGLSAGDVLDVTFLAARTAPGQVRTLVELRLGAWRMDALRDDVMLIASELVTNAAVHVPGGRIRVRFVREQRGVLFQVWDCSDVLPVRRRATVLSPDAAALDSGYRDGTGGLGLPIVAALASEYGVIPTEPHGKWAWARVTV
ncbi:hypothetical protein GCM10022254_44510 [Actinomadura meridiana]|uniref:Histidine kinase/HSP90-like ATPase domain-containing protein n=1 Tax=Actinomadura meridiana TaxID=559626 RepID=A0ABP8C9A9_9ACTN